MCHLNSYGLRGYTNSQGHFVDQLFQGSVANVHINTHKHRQGAQTKGWMRTVNWMLNWSGRRRSETFNMRNTLMQSVSLKGHWETERHFRKCLVSFTQKSRKKKKESKVKEVMQFASHICRHDNLDLEWFSTSKMSHRWSPALHFLWSMV